MLSYTFKVMLSRVIGAYRHAAFRKCDYDPFEHRHSRLSGWTSLAVAVAVAYSRTTHTHTILSSWLSFSAQLSRISVEKYIWHAHWAAYNYKFPHSDFIIFISLSSSVVVVVVVVANAFIRNVLCQCSYPSSSRGTQKEDAIYALSFSHSLSFVFVLRKIENMIIGFQMIV